MRKLSLLSSVAGLLMVFAGRALVIKVEGILGWMLVMPGIPLFFYGLASLTTYKHKNH